MMQDQFTIPKKKVNTNGVIGGKADFGGVQGAQQKK